MSDTVSNRMLVIVTNGTAHKALADKEDDTCRPEDSDKAEDFPNYIPSKGNLTEGRTARTLINEAEICVEGTKIGLSIDSHPSFDAHEPHVVNAGGSEGTYRNYATATSFSPDVKAEGKFVVRTTDTTLQNKGNTTGIIDGSDLGWFDTNELFFLMMKCSLMELTGTDDKGRTLGKQSANAAAEDYLEILTGQRVTFTGVRYDMSQKEPVKNPPCEIDPKHTRWRAVRTGGGEASVEETDEATERFVVESSLTELSGAQNDPSESKLSGGSSKSPSGKGVNASLSVSGDGGLVEAKTSLGSVEVDWQGIRRIWQFKSGLECKIQVQAIACVPKTATLRLFPARKAVFAVTIPGGDQDSQGGGGLSEAVQSVRRVLGRLSRFLDLLSAFTGTGVKLEFKVFEDFELKIEAEYKHCEREVIDDEKGVYLTPSHVGLAWELSVSCTSLLSVDFTVELPLSIVLNAIPVVGPWLAKGARWLEKRLNVGLFVQFVIGISVGLSAGLGQEQHGDWINLGNEKAATLKPRLEMLLLLRVSAIEGSVGLEARGQVHIGITAPHDPNFAMRASFSGKVENYFKAKISYKGKFGFWSRQLVNAASAASGAMQLIDGPGDAKELRLEYESKINELALPSGGTDLLRTGASQ